jgi:hypothetical protein
MIIRNSVKCNTCGVEIESRHRHDFRVHYCPQDPSPGKKWVGEGRDAALVPNGEITWNFAVDGGKDYLKRCGGGFTDTSEFTEQGDI